MILRRIIFASVVFSASALAEVVLQEQFEHYQIAPAEVDQIKFELRNNSPVSKYNKTFHGGTEWTLVPNFRWKIENNLCRIKDVQVELNGTYTLPELANKDKASEQTIQRFAAYYDALMVHEKGHQDLWIQAGNKIEKTLKEMPPHYSCYQLAERAKKRISELIDQYQQLNRHYDLTTGHGRTQGAAIR